MSAWKEWQLALKNGNEQQARLSEWEFEHECNQEAKCDRECEREYFTESEEE